MKRPHTALVLSGGGARGAYEAGILRYLREELPAEARSRVHFDVLCGSSVGAVHACFLAATMDRPQEQGRLLAQLWSELSLERVYKVQGEDLWTITRKMWRVATNEPARPEGWRLDDVLHPEPLEDLVRSRIEWPKISANLARGLLSAVSISATKIASGTTVAFVQRREGGVPAWSRDPYNVPKEAILGPEHAMASAAIPLLFRSVKIDGEYFCDGSVRQNTPLSPALRLGAEKVLLISLRFRPKGLPAQRPLTSYPTAPLLMGKVLNALMLDHTDYDLDRMRRFNTLLQAGQAAFGPSFLEKMNDTVNAMRGQPYRVVRDLVVRPSRDIASIAADYVKQHAPKPSADVSLPTKLLHRVAQSQLLTEADLASYLLFDGGFGKKLMELAMEDAHARRDELTAFFLDEPAPPVSEHS